MNLVWHYGDSKIIYRNKKIMTSIDMENAYVRYAYPDASASAYGIASYWDSAKTYDSIELYYPADGIMPNTFRVSVLPYNPDGKLIDTTNGVYSVIEMQRTSVSSDTIIVDGINYSKVTYGAIDDQISVNGWQALVISGNNRSTENEEWDDAFNHNIPLPVFTYKMNADMPVEMQDNYTGIITRGSTMVYIRQNHLSYSKNYREVTLAGDSGDKWCAPTAVISDMGNMVNVAPLMALK